MKIKSPHCTCPQSSNSLFADLFRGGLTGRGAGPSRVADGVRGAEAPVTTPTPFPKRNDFTNAASVPRILRVYPCARSSRCVHAGATASGPCVHAGADGKRPPSQLLAAPRPPPAPFSACSLRVRGPLGQRRRARAAGRLQRVVGRDNAPRSSHGVLLTPPAPAFPSRCPPVVVCLRFRWDPSHRSSAPPPSAWADTTVRRLRLSQRWRRLLPSRRTN